MLARPLVVADLVGDRLQDGDAAEATRFQIVGREAFEFLVGFLAISDDDRIGRVGGCAVIGRNRLVQIPADVAVARE